MDNNIGNYVKHSLDSEIGILQITQLYNPYNLYNLLQSDCLIPCQQDKRGHRLHYEKCDTECSKIRRKKIVGYVWRCPKRQEYSLTTGSVFSSMKYPIQDIIIFLYEYLLGASLAPCCMQSGIWKFGHPLHKKQNFRGIHCKLFTQVRKAKGA